MIAIYVLGSNEESNILLELSKILEKKQKQLTPRLSEQSDLCMKTSSQDFYQSDNIMRPRGKLS